ncbi:MAG: DUF5009 domain-containing protein [bacterium]|nr:DUF5009 domain-containing protein [bacterium]
MSLDAFRGLTIAGMILVNNPGSWGYVHGPLRHAEWNGWTPTDLVFPFFLFIVGVSMAISFRRRLDQGYSRKVLFAQVVRRTIILFLLGLIMYGFPDFRLIGPYILMIAGLAVANAANTKSAPGKVRETFPYQWIGWLLIAASIVYFVADFAHFQTTRLRVPGVLQRIAVCYFLASLVVMVLATRGRAACVVVLLIGYWLIVQYVPPPAAYVANVTGPEGLLHDWIDVQLLGEHLYRSRPDPEGILSSLPAVATVLLGVLTGQWLQTARDHREKTVGLFVAANIALLLGFCMDGVFPINKKIWSSSYVVLTAGLALHFVAMCYWLIDVRRYRRWAAPFVVFGTNAIVVFVASSLLAKMMGRWRLETTAGETTSVKAWLFENVFASWAGRLNGSLLFALVYITLWLLLLLPLHRRRIFIKI